MALAPQSILIADDNPAMRQMIRDVIGGLAGDVFEAESGEEGLRIYREKHPDWVLMDIVMPGIDGLETTQQMLQENPKARVIIVTHHDWPVYRTAAREAGAKGFVAKDNLLELRQFFEGSAFPFES